MNQLINNRDNGFPKVITGIRRCGTSFLLKEIDDDRNSVYRDPLGLGEYVREKCAEQTKLTFMHAKASCVLHPGFSRYIKRGNTCRRIASFLSDKFGDSESDSDKSPDKGDP